MSKKKTVVLFKKEGGVQIFKNPKSLSELQKLGTILVNPQLPKGIPPHEWKLINGRIRAKMDIESAFPESKNLEPITVNWFKPFMLASIIILFSVQIYEKREDIKSSYKSLIEKIK